MNYNLSLTSGFNIASKNIIMQFLQVYCFHLVYFFMKCFLIGIKENLTFQRPDRSTNIHVSLISLWFVRYNIKNVLLCLQIGRNYRMESHRVQICIRCISICFCKAVVWFFLFQLCLKDMICIFLLVWVASVLSNLKPELMLSSIWSDEAPVW